MSEHMSYIIKRKGRILSCHIRKFVSTLFYSKIIRQVWDRGKNTELGHKPLLCQFLLYNVKDLHWRIFKTSSACNMQGNLENSPVAIGLEQVSFHSNPKKGNAKECSNYNTTAHISHASKVMLKIQQARLQHYVNRELPDVQAGFRKGRGTRDQIANIHWIIEKAREFQKNIYFSYIE